MNGKAIWLCHMELQIHVELPFFLKKGVNCTVHSKILDPLGRYVILKAEIKEKLYVLINIYAPNKIQILPVFWTT